MVSRYLCAFAALFAFIAAGLISCSGPDSAVMPTAPQIAEEESGNGRYSADNRFVWGYYDAHWNPESETIDIVPRRDAGIHFNALNWLQSGPCTDCLQVLSVEDSGLGYHNCGVEITHPFDNPNLTGFDVRGIAMFDEGHEFPECGLSIPWHLTGNGMMWNPEGYTSHYSGGRPDSGYEKGRFASETAPSADLNGFIRYASTDPANNRNAFYAGECLYGVFQIVLPSNPFVFGYAVDACWAPPTTKPVNDPMTDFPPEANCPEPWRIWTGNEIGALTDYGGTVEFEIWVYDYQGYKSHDEPVIECPDIFDGRKTATLKEDINGYAIYTASVSNEKYAPEGLYPCLISVEDNENPGPPPASDLTGYAVHNLTVYESSGWAATWGGSDDDYGYDVCISDEGYVYMCGSFYGGESELVDLDPGSETRWITSNGKSDAFLSKYSQSGRWIWTETWGGSENDVATAVAAGPYHIAVVGSYFDTADFAPGGEIEEYTSNGLDDCYVNVFNKDGEWQWARAWGGASNDTTLDVAIDDGGNILTAGWFTGTVNFDPYGPGDEYSTGVWNPAAFMSKWSPGGTHADAVAWGMGYADVWTEAAGIDIDESSGIWVTGSFQDTVDFDPGPGTFEITSAGGDDAYLVLFDGYMDFTRAVAWGGSGDDIGLDVATSGHIAAVTGRFSETVDFDPGTGVDSHGSNGGYDVFLSLIDSEGNHAGTVTWGGTGYDCGMASAYTPSGIYVSGIYTGGVDFDPGPGSANKTSLGDGDAFLSGFSTDLGFDWVAVFGGSAGDDRGYGLAADDFGNSFVSGIFRGTVDFDPNGGTYERESVAMGDVFINRILNGGLW